MKQRTQTGFTLYELLTTLLVVGVVLALGVPNMTAFRQNSAMTSTANDLHSSFHLARSEASRAKTNITICASADAVTAAVPTCGGELEAGWVVFEDRNGGPGGDIAIDAGEPIIRRFGPVADGIVINTPGPNDYFSFASTGIGRTQTQIAGPMSATAPLSVSVICDDRGEILGPGGRSAARVLVVTPLGRATILSEKAQVTFHGGC